MSPVRLLARTAFVSVLGSCLVLQPLAAYAQSVTGFTGPRVIYTPTGAQVVPSMFQLLKDATQAAAGGITTAANAVGDVAVGQPVKPVVGTAGEVAMTASRTVPALSVARAAARALPLVGVGLTIYSVYDEVRCKPGSTSTLGGLVACDPGQAQSSVPVYAIAKSAAISGATGNFTGATPQAVCSDYGAAYAVQRTTANNGSPSYSVKTVSATTSLCSVTYQLSNGGTSSSSATITQTTTLQCPAYTVQGPNGPEARAAGEAPGPDGKCRTGTFENKTPEQAADKVVGTQGFKTGAATLLREAAQRGVDPEPDAGPTQLSGPASVNGPSTSTTSTTSTGQTTTSQTAPQYNITYYGDTYNYTTSTVNVTNNNGTTTTTTTTAPPEVKTCGLPGQPACKIDESGTPSFTAPTDPNESVKSQDTAKRNEVAASIQGPTFGFIGAPPLAECTPFDLPNFMGHTVGQLNPCGPVDLVRSVMAYVWALGGAWLCLGMIRRTVSGG